MPVASTHTPGPWRVENWGYADDAWPIRRLSVGAGPGFRPEAIVISPRYRHPDDPRMQADARLIAAAPDLLAALQHLFEMHMADMHDVDLGEPATSSCPTCKKASAAIDKALGNPA